MCSLAADLSIGDLAAATGVAAGTLRMWEARHGFPAATRGSGGHRRYSADEVARVARVLDERRRGLSLAAAIERVRHWAPGAPPSLFAALRERHPELPVYELPVRAMLAVSRAIEDECLATAAEPVLVGSFQRERAYRVAEPRWRELARTARLAVVLADFPRRRGRAPVEVPVPAASHVRREWAVACVAPGFSACLAGWERPAERRFEAVWSADPAAALAVARVGLESAGGSVGTRGPALLDELAPALGGDVAAATLAIANRAIGYLTRVTA